MGFKPDGEKGKVERETVSADLENFKDKYVSIFSSGNSHYGKLVGIEKSHLVLLPCLVSEGFPGNPPVYKYRIEEEIPGRVELPVNSIFPTTREYLEELVKRNQDK